MRLKTWPGWLVLGIATVVVVLDQLTKAWIIDTLPMGESIVPIPALRDYLTFTHLTNTGAAFGLFRNQGFLFVVIALVVVVAIIVYSRYLPTDKWLVWVALGLQLGGAIGNNLFDRVRLGHVTDFIYFYNLPIINRPWPAFNIADMAIVGGVALLALVLLFDSDERKPASSVEGDAGEQSGTATAHQDA